MVKTGFSKEEISAVLNESEQALKHGQKLAKVTETVAAYRLRELQYFQAREQLATWRKTHGYDRNDLDAWHPSLIATRIHCESVVRFARVKECYLDIWYG